MSLKSTNRNSGPYTALAVSAAVLFMLAAASFLSVLDGGRLLTERDLSVFFIPPRMLWVEQIKALELPLWNPYSYGGQPLFATLQPGILYPVNVLLLILPFDIAFNWTIIIHFVLAGVFTYLLARELGTGPMGSFVSAVVFMLSGFLFSTHNVISTLFTVSWAPLAVTLFIRSLRKGALRYALLTGVVLTIMFVGGGIEALFGTLLLFLILALFPVSLGSSAAAPGLGKRLFFLAAASVLFLLLSAVQLFAFLELASQSTRAAGLTYAEATTWSFDFKDFVQFLIPDPFGYGASTEKYWANQSWLKTIYTGPVPLILTVFFISKYGRRALPAIFTALVFLLLALGKNTAIYLLLYSYVPFFDKFRYPVKFLFADFIILAVLSGLGFEALLEGIRQGGQRTKRLIKALLALSALAAVLFGLLDLYSEPIRQYLVNSGIDYPAYNRVEINLFNAKRALFFFIAASVIIYAGTIKRLAGSMPYALLIILAADLFFAHNGFYASTDSRTYHSRGEVIELLSRDTSLFRAFVTPKTMREAVEAPKDAQFDKVVMKSMDLDKERLIGYNIEHRIASLDGVEVMRRGDYMAIYEAIVAQERIDSTRLLSMLNVKYVVSIPTISSPDYRLVKVIGVEGTGDLERLKAVKVYENTKALPRFYMVSDYRVVKDRSEQLKALIDRSFDPGKTVILPEEPWDGSKVLSGGGAVEVISYANNSIELLADVKARAILVASESWYPGWKVFIDGKEGKILKADYALRGVPLEEGRHIVRFEYCPLSFRSGAVVSALTLAFIVAALAYAKIRGRDGK